MCKKPRRIPPGGDQRAPLGAHGDHRAGGAAEVLFELEEVERRWRTEGTFEALVQHRAREVAAKRASAEGEQPWLLPSRLAQGAVGVVGDLIRLGVSAEWPPAASTCPMFTGSPSVSPSGAACRSRGTRGDVVKTIFIRAIEADQREGRSASRGGKRLPTSAALRG